MLVQNLLATALLGPGLIGLYGIVTTTAMTIVALRRVGIDEAFVQTAADDEEAEFQRALTVELALGVLGALAVAALAPVLAARLRRRSPARAHAGRDLSAGGVRAAGAAVGLLQAHGLRAAAHAAGDRAARDRRGRGAAAARGRRGVGAGDRAVRAATSSRSLAAWRASPYRFRLRPDREAARRYLRFSLAGVRHRGGRAVRRPGPDRGVRARRRAGGGGLDHARRDADPLRRPRRPDPRDDDLPGDRARPRPRRRARGAVRQGQPADADVGVPVRRRARAVRAGPDRVRARRRVARRDRPARRPRDRGRAAAGRLQLVRVLPGARGVVAAGGRVGWRSAPSFAALASRARCSAGRGGSSPGGSAAPRACWRSAHVYVRRLLPGVRLWRAGAARGGAGRARLGAGRGAAAWRSGAASARSRRR